MENGTTSERFAKAVQFLLDNGFARSESSIAKKIGFSVAAVNMSVTGYRSPSLELMVALCDNYPIYFDWVRTGDGGMVRTRELDLYIKIRELEGRIKALEKGK